MKKISMLLLIALIFLSCGDLLDEFNLKRKDTFDESAIIGQEEKEEEEEKEEIVAQVPPSDLFGLHYSPQEVEIWRERTKNGPYRVQGDAGPNTPGDWQRILLNKNSFLSNPKAHRFTTINWDRDQTIKRHQSLRDAAFYSLVMNDSTVARVVKEEIYWQTVTSGILYSRDITIKIDSHIWALAHWFTKLLFAYDYTKHHFTAEERERVEYWFSNAAYMFALNLHEVLLRNFPNRLQGDYSVMSHQAIYHNPDGYAYYDKIGQEQNQISNLSKWYNNRRGICLQFAGLTGVLLKDDVLINHAKAYVKEWIMYSMFPDGTTGEYERNGDYDNSLTGRYYNAINLQVAVVLADALARTGDFSLYQFSTTKGLWGTQGGPKSIKLGVISHLNEIDNTVERYCHDEKCPQGDKSLLSNNKLDAVADRGPDMGRHYVHEIWSAPMGNLYWKDIRIKDGYLRNTPNSPKYGTKFGTSGPYGPPWGGAAYEFPGMLFMFGQMENANPYEGKR